MENSIRIGAVSSVDAKKRTARVTFADKNKMVSGNLKVVINQPLCVISAETDGEAWDVSAEYASADRGLDIGETYIKKEPDKITVSKTIEYTKDGTISVGEESCGITGKLEEKEHKATVKIYPWLPYIGQMVLCVFLPNGDGDGFVIGGI